MAAELPPEDPPGVGSRFHGLRLTPNSMFLVNPVSRIRAFSLADRDCARRFEPRDLDRIGLRHVVLERLRADVVRSPTVSSRSLTPSGNPASAPTSSRRATFSSSARASAIALSARNAQNALILGLVCSILLMVSSINSLGLISRFLNHGGEFVCRFQDNSVMAEYLPEE